MADGLLEAGSLEAGSLEAGSLELGEGRARAQELDGAAAVLPQAVDDLRRLVEVDTSFPPGAGYGPFVDLLEDLLGPLDFAIERHEMPEALWRASGSHGARINAIARRRQPSGRPPLGIYFHMDTVPAGTGWRASAFRLRSEGGRHYGRGTADMKGAIAAVLAALRTLTESAAPLAYEPVLLFCTDEEGGLYPGIRWLEEEGLVPAHLLNLNGGAVPRHWAGCFGSLDLRVTLTGRSAHSGDPGAAGVNALEWAVPVANALLALKPAIEARRSDLPPPPHLAGTPLAGRLSLTAMEGGAKGSALPGQAILVLNRRYAPEEDFEAVRGELEQAIAAAVAATPLVGSEVEIVGHLAPVQDPDGPHWPRWMRAMAEGFGWRLEDFSRFGSGTSSDMGWISAPGRELLLGGLARPDRNLHAGEEHTTDDDLLGLARAVAGYLRSDFAPELVPAEER